MGSITPDTTLRDTLPTLEHLNVTLPDDLDAQEIAQAWVTRFSDAVKTKDVTAILKEVHPEGWWRDLVALTWDTRTFQGADRMRQFLNDRLTETKFSVGATILSVLLAKPYPGVVWIVAQFSFETVTGTGLGTTFLIPTHSGEWVSYIICTDLDSLKGARLHFGAGRDATMGRAHAWLDDRAREQAFEDHNPEVLIVGGGQAGLDIAARLKDLGVSALIVEKNARVGDQWRKRYDSLRLHDFVWLDSQPYLKFPDSFPIHIPAKKLADWYESYATVMDLNVWTSSTVSHAKRDDGSGKWTVTVSKQDGSQRVLVVDHLVFATGWVGEPNIPVISGRDEFRGEVMHSEKYSNARSYVGKKIIIVGGCTSAHDIAVDFADLGIDVTMFQRSSTLMEKITDLQKSLAPLYREDGPPLELADKINSAMPFMVQRLTGGVEMNKFWEEDAERREKLHKVGYRMNKGVDGTGAMWQIVSRGGGQYLDQGACDLILEGKIKVKSDTQIERFTSTGLRFLDGTELTADVIILATGYGDLRVPIKKIIGEESGKKLTKIWGVNEEGELNSIAKEAGIPGLWYLSGSLSFARIYSKHIALRT
ncbi:hypothetical protein EIP91_012336 [Steccherinum ochraceum]|uniref:FAD/NAD(P)-binding domain-containing protein n=1 Tax=Steccherinum ochraceum TaxID=92696 RepID=A0A4R0RN74_9APHY|nr:hypothetical protein EIP91_012336 [Steccherinum ochraceum]